MRRPIRARRERVAAMRARRPDADIRMIPGAGHWVAYEAPEQVNATLLEMLPRTRPVRRGGSDMSDASEIERGPGEMMGNAGPGMLAGLRVIEIADERAEYTGLLMAGLGAEVIKIEPPEGNATRRIGPFLEDQPGLERSLFFWNYNRNKKSVVLDLREAPAQRAFAAPAGGRRRAAGFVVRRAERGAGSGSRAR